MIEGSIFIFLKISITGFPPVSPLPMTTIFLEVNQLWNPPRGSPFGHPRGERFEWTSLKTLSTAKAMGGVNLVFG